MENVVNIMTKIDIRETKLAGVGVQHDFPLETGGRIGVITHHTGRRDFLVFSHDDPDFCSIALQFSEDEARLLGQLMGVSQVVQAMADIHQFPGGLAIDWITIGDQWTCRGESVQSLGLSSVGINIIAILRLDTTHTAPLADFKLLPQDTIIMTGTPEDILKAIKLMQGTGA